MIQTASFGYWVRRRRRALELTQAELARQVGCAVATIKKIEADSFSPGAQLPENLPALEALYRAQLHGKRVLILIEIHRINIKRAALYPLRKERSMTTFAAPAPPTLVPLALAPGSRRPPITSVCCLDGSWYISLFGPRGTWVFAWNAGGVAKPVANAPLIDGYGWLSAGGDNSVYLWGFHQRRIVCVTVGRQESASASAASFGPRPVPFQFYAPDANPLNVVSCKRCLDGSWYIATFVADARKSASQGMWVFRWGADGGAALPLFNQPLTTGTGWLQVGGNDTVQLWTVQKPPNQPNEIAIKVVGPLSGVQPVGGIFSGKQIKVNLPLYPGGYPYGQLSSMRCSDGSWYVSVFVADARKSSKQGTWAFKWTNNGAPGVALASSPILDGTGTLALGADRTVQLWGGSDQSHNQVMYAALGPLS